jgi:predicted transcriptional regulator
MSTEDKKPNNPSVFPYQMTLRDYFAAKADIPYNVIYNILEKEHGEGKVTLRMIANKRSEYKFLEAYAMLKQREL